MAKASVSLKFYALTLVILAGSASGDTTDWNLLTGVRATPAQLDIQDRKAGAHRLRLSDAILTALSHPEFLERFPEFRPLAAQLEKVIRVVSQHDWYKNTMSKNSSVIQTLAKADAIGVDYRSLEPNNRFRKAMEEAIKTLNGADDARWSKLLEAEFKNPAQRKLVSDLVTAADWYDVPFARGTDFGAHREGHLKRPIEHGRDWILSQQKIHGLPNESVNRMVGIADFFDVHIDYKAIAARHSPESLKKVTFEKGLSGLLNVARLRTPGAIHVAKTKMRGAVGSVLSLIPSALTAGEIINDPKSVDPKDLASDLAGSVAFGYLTSTGDCDTPECGEWLDECRTQNLDDQACMRLFFTYPLERQSSLRLNPETNKRLASASGRVDELKCEKNPEDGTLVARLQFSKPGNVVFHQILQFGKSGKVTKSQVRNLSELSPRHHIMSYDQSGVAGNLQYYSVDENRYKNLPAEEWTSHVTHLISFESRATNDSLESAVQAHRLVETNAAQILRCCERVACREGIDKVTAQALSSTGTYIRPIKVAQ